jgi:hypothetical protein
VSRWKIWTDDDADAAVDGGVKIQAATAKGAVRLYLASRPEGDCVVYADGGAGAYFVFRAMWRGHWIVAPVRGALTE